jgi:hypothetical protein
MTFEEAWAKQAAAGYSYGEDALERVHFGWEIATAVLAAGTSKTATFEEEWAKQAAAGYRYGEFALREVHFGWKIAMREAALLEE